MLGHQVSYAYGQINDTNFLEEHPMVYHRFLKDKEALAYIDQLFQRAHQALLKHNEPGLAEILQKLSKNYVSKFTLGYGGHDGRFLTHGDMWSNNVMFNAQNQCLLKPNFFKFYSKRLRKYEVKPHRRPTK